MPRKRNEARSIIPEGGAVTRRRTSHAKAAQHAEPVRETETPKAVISEQEEISRIAYTFWEERGRQDGSHEEDWLRAEQEFRRRRAAAES
jgi:hypothetical protein